MAKAVKRAKPSEYSKVCPKCALVISSNIKELMENKYTEHMKQEHDK